MYPQSRPWLTQPSSFPSLSPRWVPSMLSLFCGYPGYVDLVTGSSYVVSNDMPILPGSGGVGAQGNASDRTARLDIATRSFDGVTILAVVGGGAANLDARAFNLGYTVDNDNYIAIGTGSAAGAKARVLTVASGNAGTTSVVTTANVFDGLPHAVILRWIRGVGTQAFVDGQNDAFAANAFNTALIVNRVGIGSLFRLNPAAYFGGQVFLGASFGSALSDSECREISFNPWAALFQPQRIWIPAPTAAAFKPFWARGSNVLLGAGVVQ